MVTLRGYDRWLTTEPVDELADRAAEAAADATTEQVVELLGAEAVFGEGGYLIVEEVLDDPDLERALASVIVKHNYSPEAVKLRLLPAMDELFASACDRLADRKCIREQCAEALLETYRETPEPVMPWD
jgi:hypothetical protein